MNIIECGVIQINDEFTPICANPETGECFFQDPLMGHNRLIGELSVDDPIDSDAYELAAGINAGNYGDCIGVILDGDTIITLLSETLACLCKVDDEGVLQRVGEPYTIDIDIDYDDADADAD